MLARELDDPLEEALRRDRAGRVVRVVQVHQLRPARRLRVDRVQVGDEAQLGLERHQHRLRPGQPRAGGVDRIARVGGERVIAGVEEREVQVEDRLLRADRRDDLALGVELDVEAPLVKVAHRFTEVRAPAV